LGVNSFRPHAAANVLQNQFGDCKDKANLLNTLLRAVNIQAHLVLVPRFSQAHDGLPGLAFNHAISRIALDGQPLWADTTDEVCRFGLLPPGDPGRNVLVIDGQTTALTRLPPPEPRDHLLKVRGEIDCTKPADTLPMTLRADAIGFPDYFLRAAAREVKEHDTSRPLLAARFRPVAGSFALQNQSATKAAALDEPFSWRAQGACVGISSIHTTRASDQSTNALIHQSINPSIQQSNTPAALSLHSPFWLPKEWDLALHHRLGQLFLNEGYPLTLDEEFAFALPATAQSLALPEAVENANAPLSWKIEWAKGGEARLVARFHAELENGELSIAETRELQAQLLRLVSALAVGAEIQR
jgi:hypothetical protein